MRAVENVLRKVFDKVLIKFANRLVSGVANTAHQNNKFLLGMAILKRSGFRHLKQANASVF